MVRSTYHTIILQAKMDAATIAETNKVRVSLGLKPLPVPGAARISVPVAATTNDSDEEDEEQASTLETRNAQAFDNFKRVQ